MTSKNRILIGSYRTDNVQRIRSRLESNSQLVVVESWEEFVFEEGKNNYQVQITDLNLRDCFPAVVIGAIYEKENNAAVVILLENVSDYRMYRERAHPLIEILPIEIADDERFVSTIVAAQAKYDLLKDLL